MHGIHAWTERLEDGTKREVRAVKFGGIWRIESRFRRGDRWELQEPPPVESLATLLDILKRKYQRRRAAYDDILAVERLLREIGGQ